MDTALDAINYWTQLTGVLPFTK